MNYETVPRDLKETEPPIIPYTYTETITSKIFNFSSTLSSFDCRQFDNSPSQGWYYNAIRDPKNCNPDPKSAKMLSKKY